jgi:hypothetical protein
MVTEDKDRTNRLVVGLLFLAVFSPRCFAQGDKPVTGAPTRVETPTPPLAGCYELKLGRWWPWAFGEDTKFVTPPDRIQLLPERGTEGFEQDRFLIRTIPRVNGTTSGRGGPSYWQVKTGNQVDLIWNNGFTGVTLMMEKHGDDLRGWAHPHFDAPKFVPRVARVTARRISCNVPQ